MTSAAFTALPWRLEVRSVRTRVIAAVLALTALALTVSGVTAYSLERALGEQRVHGYLDRTADEFRLRATQGTDPDTGTRFTSADDLIRVTMQRTVLAPTEGMLGIIGDQVKWTAPAGVTFRPESDRTFVDDIRPLASRDNITRGRLQTQGHDYLYIVVPARFPGSKPSGALVQVFDMDAEEAHVIANYRTYAIVALGSLAAVGIAIWFLVGRLLRPIRLLRTTAEDITEHDLSRRIPVEGSDDLSQLTGTVNAMLDRLESAVETQRRLLDDVGHELRTPLTIVRGHLELVDAQDPDDVRSTRTMALDELDRMGRLVDDLITLARAERTDFVRFEPVDVGALTDETLEKARRLAPRSWLLDDLADVQTVLDPQRITQAWLQLASNAVQYSPGDKPIALGSRVVGDELRLWVRDQGIGIGAEDQRVVLTRSVRSRDARSLRPEGSGLGLAIVTSIVQAHQGRIELTSTPGLGSTFTIVLPQARDQPAKENP